MQHDPVLHSKTLGADLRALRRARGMTLQNIAGRLRRSVGWVSQIERDLSEPSISDLRHIVKLFEVPVSFLFGTAQAAAEEAGYVVRAGARRQIGRGDLIGRGRRFAPTPDKSFRIRAEPFEWTNPYDDPAVAIWVIAPPVY